MRFVVLAVILLSLPVFINLLRQNPHKRPLALMAIGFMLFCGGTLQIDASIIGWPMWNGIARGMELSPVDALSVALLVTRGRRSGSLPFWGILAFYGATLMVSILAASVWMATVFVWWQYARCVLVFAAIASECDRPASRLALLQGIAIGLAVQAGYVVNQKAHGMVQATGTMYHQNTLGMMVEMALMPLFAALIAGERSKLVKLGVVSALLIIAGGGSRGAMAFGAGGVAIFSILSLIRGVTPVKAKVIGLGVLAAVVVVPIGMMTLKERFGDTAVTTQEEQRALFEKAARAMSADHPIGVGANLYVPTANLKGYADKAGVAWNFANRSAPVHNAYLLARAETGWAGELGVILLLGVPLVAGLRLAFRNRRNMAGEIALGSAAALGVNAVHNNFEYAFFTYSVLSIVAVNVALIAAQIYGASRSRPREPAPERGARRDGIGELSLAH